MSFSSKIISKCFFIKIQNKLTLHKSLLNCLILKTKNNMLWQIIKTCNQLFQARKMKNEKLSKVKCLLSFAFLFVFAFQQPLLNSLIQKYQRKIALMSNSSISFSKTEVKYKYFFLIIGLLHWKIEFLKNLVPKFYNWNMKIQHLNAWKKLL